MIDTIVSCGIECTSIISIRKGGLLMPTIFIPGLQAASAPIPRLKKPRE